GGMKQLLVPVIFFASGVVLSGCSKSESAASTSQNPASTSEAIQNGAPSALPGSAPTAKVAARTCPPGAKCDGYCAPDQKQIADGVACATCTANECDVPLTKGCSASPDPKSCEAIVQCFHRTNCLKGGGVVACYCGDASIDTCTAKGPSGGKCTDVIESG